MPDADTDSATAYTKSARSMRMVGDGLFRIRTIMPIKVPQMPEPTVDRKNIKMTYAMVVEFIFLRCPARCTRTTATASFISDSFSTT